MKGRPLIAVLILLTLPQQLSPGGPGDNNLLFAAAAGVIAVAAVIGLVFFRLRKPTPS